MTNQYTVNHICYPCFTSMVPLLSIAAKEWPSNQPSITSVVPITLTIPNPTSWDASTHQILPIIHWFKHQLKPSYLSPWLTTPGCRWNRVPPGELAAARLTSSPPTGRLGGAGLHGRNHPRETVQEDLGPSAGGSPPPGLCNGGWWMVTIAGGCQLVVFFYVLIRMIVITMVLAICIHDRCWQWLSWWQGLCQYWLIVMFVISNSG